MSENPINLAFRFLLELAGLAALSYWGWSQFGGVLRVALGIGLPFLTAILWATFRVPGDSSSSGRAPVRVPGLVRLLLEIVLLGGGALALFQAGQTLLAGLFTAGLIVHYALSLDRVRWLLTR